MKRFPKQMIGWIGVGLIALAVTFPMSDWLSRLQLSEQASAAFKMDLPHTNRGRGETFVRTGKPPASTITRVSHSIQLNELPEVWQQELREQFGQHRISEIRMISEQGKNERYEVYVDHGSRTEKVLLYSSTNTRIMLKDPEPSNPSK